MPEPYKAMENPTAGNDDATVAAGRELAVRNCSVCHGAGLSGNAVVGAPDLMYAAATRSEQFLLWAISEGSRYGMPAWKARFSEEQRWQIIAFLKSLTE